MSPESGGAALLRNRANNCSNGDAAAINGLLKAPTSVERSAP